MSAEVKSMKEWALYYAELGLAVFPLAYRNKVPAIEGGCKAATTEKSKIERWWNQNPRYNIGIATGNKSNGLVVIDLDVDKNKGIDGYEVLRDWQNKHGELPETWQSITGRGGYHYFYKDTITHSNKVGLYEGVDIRGEGGYIVAPPSVHPNGNTYEWEQEPKEYEIAQVDDIVNDFFKGEKQRIDSEHKTNFKVPELIPEGKRVDTIVRLIASLRTRILSLFVMDFIGGLSPERTIIMKIMTQDKTRVLNFKMTYISYVSKNRICEGDFGIAEYASPERAKEVLNDMFQKYAAGEKAYIMPEE